MKTKPRAQSLEELNEKVHKLTYVEPGGTVPKRRVRTDQNKARDLAKSIRENIRTYENRTRG